MAIQPHAAFETTTPDTFAECTDGILHNTVVPDLYEQLWACVPAYDDAHRANIEDIGPGDVVGLNSLADFWDRFDDVAKVELNRLAEAHDAYIEALVADGARRLGRA